MSLTPAQIEQAAKRYDEGISVERLAADYSVCANSMRKALRKAGMTLRTLAEARALRSNRECPNFVCPRCSQPGKKKVSRTVCVACVQAEQRQRWQDRKDRSIDGTEQLSIAAVGGWQPAMASDHLRKAWPLQVTA